MSGSPQFLSDSIQNIIISRAAWHITWLKTNQTKLTTSVHGRDASPQFPPGMLRDWHSYTSSMNWWWPASRSNSMLKKQRCKGYAVFRNQGLTWWCCPDGVQGRIAFVTMQTLIAVYSTKACLQSYTINTTHDTALVDKQWIYSR